MTSLKTGVVGCGYLGRHHARILSTLEGSSLAGFVETDDAAAAAIEAAHGATGMVRRGSIRELLDAGATAVVIASPTVTHAAVAQELLEGGADVMVEKPITATLAEADRLVAVAREKGRILQVGHIERFNPAVAAVRPLVTDVKFIEAHRLGVFVPRALDVDVVLDLLVHDLDIALDLVGRPVVEIRAVGVPILSNKIDIASVRLSFEGGCVANLTASRVSQEKTRKFRFFQPDWYFSIDTQKRDVTAFRLDRLTGPPRIVPWPVAVAAQDPLTAEDAAFLKACRERSEPEVTGEAGRAALKLALDILEEMGRGRRRSRERAAPQTRPSSPSKKIFSSSSSSIPRIGLIGGSGLYSLPGLVIEEERRVRTPFGTPSDAYFLGSLASVPVVFLARHGRQHHLLPTEVNYRANIWGLKALGCSWLVSASACGSMKEAYKPTDIVLPDQFIDLTKHRESTFFGDGCVGHVSFSHPVSTLLLDALEAAGKAEKAVVHRGGTYVCMEGPQFSTKAESLLYRSWGVDVIGMTNATEAKLSREAGIAYASACLVTDYDCWHEEEGPVSVEAVLAVLKENAATANRVLANAVARLDPARPSDCDDALAFAVLTHPARVPARTRKRLALLTQKGRP